MYNKKRKLCGVLAVLAALSMTLGGCMTDFSSTSGTTAAETAAAETAAAEAESSEDTTDETATVDFSAGLDDDGNLADVEDVSALVTLPDYRNAVLAESDVTVTDEEVQEEIDTLLDGYAETSQVTDRAVEDGDTVNIDYVGSVDGEEFDGGSTGGSGTDVTIGVTSYIDDFLEQLIGHMPGETINVEVTFPDPYSPNEDLSGKDAVFVTTINYITETVTPELTEEFVTENLTDSYGYTSVEDMKAAIREDLEFDKEYSAVWTWLTADSVFSELPESLVENIIQIYVDYYTLYASYYSMTLEDYLSYHSIDSEDAFREQLRDGAEKSAKKYIIAQAIAEAEELVIDEDALNEYFDGEDYDTYVSYYGLGYLKMQIRLEKVAKLVADLAVIE